MFSLREGLNLEMSKLSRIRSSKLEEEWQDEIMEKSLGEIVWWVWWMWAWMLEREVVVSFLPVKGEIPMCSEIRVCKWRRVWPKYNAPQHWHFLSLKGKKLDNYRPDWKIKHKETRGKAEEHNLVIWVRISPSFRPVIPLPISGADWLGIQYTWLIID